MRHGESTTDETLKLFQKGLTPDEIARERSLAVSTVYSHLEQFVKVGKIDLSRLIDQPTFEIIKTAVDLVGSWTLSAIKGNCPDNINYSEIRLVVAYLDFTRGQKTGKAFSVKDKLTRKELESLNKTSQEAKEFYRDIYVRHYKTLSPQIKEILSKNYATEIDLLPWVKNRSKNFHIVTNGDKFLERELSTFISTLRTELVNNGYDFTLQKKSKAITPIKPTITELTAEEAHKKVRELKPENTERIEAKLKEPQFPLYKESFIKEQYHLLICAYPYRVRAVLIKYIPTVEDFYKKAFRRGIEFSSRLQDKKILDTFLEIFRQIYERYYTEKLYAFDLYRARLQREPSNDLTEEEFKKLDKAENPQNYWKSIRDELWEINLVEILKPRFQFVDSGDLWFCEQKEEPYIEYYDPFTAYEDFLVLAITTVQSARSTQKSVMKFNFELGLIEIATITSFSNDKITLSVGDSYGIRDACIYKKKESVYVDGEDLKRTRTTKTSHFFDSIVEKERDFQKWLMTLRKVLLEISHDRLIVYSDFYTIRVFDKSNSKSCSIYTLVNWIEKNGIRKVAAKFTVSDSPATHPKNFPGKYHF